MELNDTMTRQDAVDEWGLKYSAVYEMSLAMENKKIQVVCPNKNGRPVLTARYEKSLFARTARRYIRKRMNAISEEAQYLKAAWQRIAEWEQSQTNTEGETP